MNDAKNPEWTQDLGQLLNASWQALEAATVTDRLEARVANLASIGPDGGPESRFVVIRKADRLRGSIDIYTDASTPKCAEFLADARAALTLWREDLLLQLRLRGAVDIIEGHEADEAWRGLPVRSLPDYGVTPAPGSDIPRANAYERTPNAARFAILRLTLAELDVVSLHRPKHSRAYYERRDGWRGVWRAP